MDIEVKNVGWEGKVGSLERAKYSAPAAQRLEGLSPENDESAINGGLNIATGMSSITPDTTTEIDINVDTDEEGCDPDSGEEGGDDVSDADDYD